MSERPRISLLAVLLGALALVAVACGAPGNNDDQPKAAPVAPSTAPATSPPGTVAPGTQITLLTHDSFAVSDAVLQEFEDRTGITVKVLQSGDAVEMVNKAILTKDHPEADVLYGIDNDLLTRGYAAGLFEPYESPGLANVDPSYQLDAEHRVTPVDVGDVCINYDRGYFTSKGIPAPTSLDDLTDPRYKGLLVVENPATSTPGLAFMLATIAKYGTGDAEGVPWIDYWTKLKANDVAIADGWEQAYYDRFSGGSGKGDRPLVVSYASSPAAEVTNADVPADQAPTGSIDSTCFRQIEFAGVLAGTAKQQAAEMFVDFLLSKSFQEDVPGQMYVYPVTRDAVLPATFAKYARLVADPLTLDPQEIGANRDSWVEQWSQTMGQ